MTRSSSPGSLRRRKRASAKWKRYEQAAATVKHAVAMLVGGLRDVAFTSYLLCVVFSHPQELESETGMSVDEHMRALGEGSVFPGDGRMFNEKLGPQYDDLEHPFSPIPGKFVHPEEFGNVDQKVTR